MNHHIHHEHTHHEDQQMSASHHEHEGMIGDFKKRFLVSLMLTIPILLLSKMIQEWSGINISFPYDDVVLLLLSTIVYFYGGWPFLKGSLDEMKQKNPGMMMLIALAISVAYFYSVGIILGLGEGHDFFWELATLIDIMLLGHWIEMKSIMGASNALQELVKLLPSIAHRIDDEKIEDIAVSELQTGDVILIKPGEQVPVDGKIIKGATTVDESMLTGESLPIEKKMDDNVIAGSINQEGSLTVETKNTGESTYLSKVIELVSEAQASKSKTQNLANRAAKILFYVAVFAGVLTFIIWLALGYPLSIAIERMVTVMVISCPHALGLAAPLVVSVSTALSAKKGLLIRNRTQFEEARKLDAIIFDKTGTLTQGNFGVTDLMPVDEISSNELLRLAAGVERSSQHPLAKGVVKRAEELQLSLPSIEDFMSITGVGLEGKVEGTLIRVVSPRYIRQEKITVDELAFEKLSEEGKTVIFVLKNKQLLGMIALADLVREEAKETVTALKNKGINSIMLTGDNKKVAHWVAKQLGIDEVHAEVLPDDKSRQVKNIQLEGRKVAMVGDGINDAPALAQADVGIAIGSGTDVAVETADIVLVRSNPKDVLSILELSRSTYNKMIQNLWWAAGYNVITIPLAAGVLAPYGVILSPAIGAVLMSLSTVIVAVNARTLKI
ncbi:copper-translocating P-type ATPase [Exiguobacterium sp. U13-1]|uniref:P-type Cu(+) transporter n=1 Tax=Exiguobacterium acetylicum TaxID=41170 RepID=A0ABX8GD68_EXIAC|nr:MULTISPECIES: heavy metal translocating P-type ATPase [Exiguobacterium]AOT00613.1 copper-translocating P-type ATPase [Exiguobacterium sp. U13-1]QWB31579.1 copper-translocating P-type ATPase [Exiguobacterium acetylicum]